MSTLAGPPVLRPPADVAALDADVVAEIAGVLSGGAADVDSGTRRRAEYSSDASVYRVAPRAVVFPRTAEDIVAVMRIARSHQLPVTMRGAGTSIAGNAIGPGVVLDTSRHYNRILSLDPEARTAVVQPGVLLAAIQKAGAPHGLRFGPDPSTWTRCTIGGSIGNNACGPHALAWGRSADQVIDLDVVDGTGRRFTASTGLDEFPELRDIVHGGLATIRREFGTFGRQVSGYSLEHLLPERKENLARMLAGTEGTLCVILQATIRLVPVPTAPHLVVLGYPDMFEAADDVVNLLPLKPLAIEGMDSRLVDVVRQHKGDGAVPDLPKGAGWMMVEVGGVDEADARERAHQLAEASASDEVAVFPPGPDATAMWRIRADGAGLGGRTPAGEQAWPNWEDAAVPPARLGEYLRRFDALMKEYRLDGLMYGHFGDGCTHIRIDFPLDRDPQVMRDFMERAADLVATYGGSLSGEHGDGRARSELLPRMYSADAIDLFRRVKGVFDPDSLLNPGVLVDPDPIDEHVRRPNAGPVPASGGFSFESDHGDFSTAVHRCMGVGKCRADMRAAGGFMCPSYQASKDEKDSTRARARVLEEMIRGTLVDGGWDAPEVADALDLCLSCKACSSDCPAGIDMAQYKSEVLYHKHKGRVRPISHYSLGWLPRWLRLVGIAPAAVNAIMKVPGVQQAIIRGGGMDRRRRMPGFAPQQFGRWLKRDGRRRSHDFFTDVDWVASVGGRAGAATGMLPVDAADSDARRGAVAARRAGVRTPVVLWTDSFSNGIAPEIPRAAVAVLEDAGYEVVLPPDNACCGLTWITTGQLDGAKSRLEDLLGKLGPFAARGIPILGLEPSCTAVLRSDLLHLLPNDPRSQVVADHVFTLSELLSAPAPLGPRPDWRLPDLHGTTAVVQPHCHQYSVIGFAPDRALLKRAGVEFTELAGCCGLAGNFGMEKGHYETSVAVAENALLPALREADQSCGGDYVYLADGFSCRTQADNLADKDGRALAQLLADGLHLRY
ncbi:FAD-binding oxidoreductase [Pseudoclavibacter sp. CFCC 14310]|uniref:FAD-binding and (Fe-S)-binding domain-containing protein n=1 Tax=Pseudoclavibacter sp. CFCC 14310 TaxID=2615180 RepID=UPI001300E2D9|nr:FAD-binding and (Fe-S)-binding domain-containing protein [Pseudoclavibacter sp. CFCC 14310]KAB1645618.1 FAD-binding oxidoreductase [Pseudoclavibacter sp. CFCC 14310]KAB1645923.1 FAD-binding oxidoreductase [Pseudoclavibacter sp. CFCC 14310]